LESGTTDIILNCQTQKLLIVKLCVVRDSLIQCFSNFFIPSHPSHSRHVIFAPQAQIKIQVPDPEFS